MGVTSTIKRRLTLGLGLLLIVGVSLAAQTSPATSPVIRTTRLEVVDDTGRVVFTAEARKGGGSLQVWNQNGKVGVGTYVTEAGGRIEVLTPDGRELFSAGPQSGTALPGLWEREHRTVEQQRRDLSQQHQELSQTVRQQRTVEQQVRSGGDTTRLELMVEQQRRDIDQQRRDIDQQRRLLDALERQLRSLERR